MVLMLHTPSCLEWGLSLWYILAQTAHISHHRVSE